MSDQLLSMLSGGAILVGFLACLALFAFVVYIEKDKPRCACRDEEIIE